MVRRKCFECQSPLSADEIEDGYCEACGAKIPAARRETDDGDDKPRSPRRRALQKAKPESESHDSLMRLARKQAANTLFAVAVLLLISGLVTVFVFGDDQGLSDEEKAAELVVFAGLSVTFAGLGFWALFMPIPPAIVGLVLFIGISIIQIAGSPQLAAGGIALRILVVVVLIKAIITAIRASKLAPEERDYDDGEDYSPPRPRRRRRDEYDDE